jgi:mRNA interferase RelE/StbE
MGSYRVEIAKSVKRELRNLPGHARTMVFLAIQSLESNPRPHTSKGLKSTKDFRIPQDVDVRRIRIDRWRVIYIIEKDLSVVTVLAIRKRPPYQYDDLENLIEE